MSRIMAIDYGRKRTGLAVTDPLQMIATALTTVATHELISFLDTYLAKERVEAFVVGYPLFADGTPSETAITYVDPFVRRLRKHFPQQPVTLLDERYTSKMAFQAMIDGGLKKKARARKETIDTVSAVILLQDFMASDLFTKNVT